MAVRARRRTTKPRTGTPRHVLVADDGVDATAPARAFALTLAVATGARLAAVYVRAPHESTRDARRKLELPRAAAAAGLACRVVIADPVGVTNPGRRILDAARRLRADVIVLGAGGSGVARKLLGSVSSYVASRAPVSVCVIR